MTYSLVIYIMLCYMTYEEYKTEQKIDQIHYGLDSM